MIRARVRHLGRRLWAWVLPDLRAERAFYLSHGYYPGARPW